MRAVSRFAQLQLAAALCLNCGGKSTEDGTEPPDPPVGCTTLCEDGEVCEAGVCESMHGCPQSRPPRLVYSSEHREQLIEARVGGTSFLTEALRSDAERTLIDLAGTRTVVQGAGHFVLCRSDLAPCYASNSGMLAVFSEYRLSMGNWQPGFETEFALAGGAQAIDAETLLVWDPDSLSVLDIYSRVETVLASYEPMNLAGWILPDGDSPGQLFGIRGATIEVADMVEKTEWQPVVEVTDAHALFVLVPGKDSAWYLVQDVQSTGHFRVSAIRGDSPHVLGEGADPIIPAIAERYAWGREALEEGHIGYGVTCGGNACEYKRVDLDTMDVVVVDKAVISDKQAVAVSQIRPLPCGAVDVLLRAADDVGPIEYWAGRFTRPE
ncbi:MAG TPA: hypothetical protein VI197_33540 [Polyangiaceae bacterium]